MGNYCARTGLNAKSVTTTFIENDEAETLVFLARATLKCQFISSQTDSNTEERFATGISISPNALQHLHKRPACLQQHPKVHLCR